MNGRVMDAKIGRFLSADPYVSDPLLTQSFNRYSYVNNNPLSFTDPSGFCVEGFSCVGTAILTVASWAFGKKKKKRPPPKGCFVAATGCYGQAGLGRIPGFNSTLSDRDDGLWAGCKYCLSLDDETTGSVFYEFGKDLDKYAGYRHYSPRGAN
jgi:hypothetical protein